MGRSLTNLLVLSVSSVDNGLRILVVVVINLDAHPCLALPDLHCHLEDTRKGVLWLDYTV